MNTFVLLGLIVALALFLMRSRRRSPSRDSEPGAVRPRRGGFRRSAPEPEPSPGSETPGPAPFTGAAAPFTSAPRPFAPLPVETAVPLADAPPAAPAPVAAEWAPPETIIEPGWPLPGEIGGAWTVAPHESAAPTGEMPMVGAVGHETAATAAVESIAPSPETRAPADDEVDSWSMPEPPPHEPAPAADDLLADAPAAPMWAPGAIEDAAAPAWPAGDEATPPWTPGADDATATPPLWSAADDALATGAWAPADDATDDEVRAPADELGLPVWQPVAAPPAMAAPGDAADIDPETAPAPMPAPEPVPAIVDDAEPVHTPDPPAPLAPAEPAIDLAVDTPPDDLLALEPVPAAAPAPEPSPAIDWGMPVVETAPAYALVAELFAPAEPAPPAAPIVPAAEAGSAAPAEEIPDGDLGAVSDEVARLLPDVVGALRPLVSVSDHVGVTPRMLIVVRALAERPLSVGELATNLDVSRPVIADIANRLDSGDLIRRERDERDRRRVRLVLTDRGMRLHSETSEAPAAGALARALAGIAADERAALLTGLRALSRSATA